MTFDDASSPADQELSLVRDCDGTTEYATKWENNNNIYNGIRLPFKLIFPPRIVTFSSVYHLTLYFPKNFGDDTTKINFIGLKGDWSEGHRHGVTLCTYEATPSMADHKDKIVETNNMNIHWSISGSVAFYQLILLCIWYF